MIVMHKCLLDIREEMKASSYGLFHIAEIHSKRNGLNYIEVLDCFKAKFPRLYPLCEGD